MQQQFGLISQAITEQNQIINNANAEVANIQGQVTEQQEQINEIIKQIEEKQAKLAQEKEPEKQKELLAEIGTLSAGIVELIQQVPKLMEQIYNNAAVVTQAASEIETAKGNSVEIQSNGILKITELVAEEAKEVQSNTATAAEAPINTATSAEAAAVATEAAATSVVSFGTTAPIAAKATKVSVDQGAAAGIKVAGTTVNLKNVFTGIQGLSNGAELISSYTQTIGSAIDAFDGCVGNWNSIIEPLVTSIGSYEDVQVSNQELQTAVAKDVETVEAAAKTTSVNEENTNTEENNNDIVINNSNNIFAQNSVSNEKSKTELETPKVKVIAFGI